jgi:hypothetical protein
MALLLVGVVLFAGCDDPGDLDGDGGMEQEQRGGDGGTNGGDGGDSGGGQGGGSGGG